MGLNAKFEIERLNRAFSAMLNFTLHSQGDALGYIESALWALLQPTNFSYIESAIWALLQPTNFSHSTNGASQSIPGQRPGIAPTRIF